MITTSVSPVTSPSASALSELSRQVKSWILAEDDDDLNVAVRDAINEAIDTLNTYSWKKLYGSQRIDLLANYGNYGLSPSFKNPLYAEFLDQELVQTGQLPYLPYQQFFREFQIRERSRPGSPTAYTIELSSFRLLLDTPPSIDFVSVNPHLSLYFHKRLARLVYETSVHGGPPEFDSYLKWRARELIAYDHEEIGKGDRARDRAEAALLDLRRDDHEFRTDYVRTRTPTGRFGLPQGPYA